MTLGYFISVVFASGSQHAHWSQRTSTKTTPTSDIVLSWASSLAAVTGEIQMCLLLFAWSGMKPLKTGCWSYDLTPSLPQPVKFLGWKMHRHACKQYILRSYNIYFQCCVFGWKSFHIPVWKRREKQLRFSNIVLLIVVFKWHHGSEGVKLNKPKNFCDHNVKDANWSYS